MSLMDAAINMGNQIQGNMRQVGGMVYQGWRDRRNHQRNMDLQNNQFGNQQQLNQQQFGNQQQLNRQGHQYAMDLWNKTNVGPQMEKMKEAGLNPALMYGQGGGTGTTQGQSGGNAQGGSAAGGGGSQFAPAMDLSAMMSASQIRLNNSQANKNDAEATKIGGPDTKNTEQDTLTKETQAALNKVIADSKNQDIAESIQRVENLAEQKKLTEQQTKLAKQQIIVNRVRMDLDKANIKLTEQKTKESLEGVKKMWKDFGLSREDVKTRKNQAKINKFTAEMKVKYPSLWNVFGKLLNDGSRLGQTGEKTLDNLLWWFGMEREDREKVEDFE